MSTDFRCSVFSKQITNTEQMISTFVYFNARLPGWIGVGAARPSTDSRVILRHDY